MRRGALGGTVRLEAVRASPRAYVLSLEAALARPLELYAGNYHERLLSHTEHHAIVVPAARALPWERVAVRADSVTFTDAPTIEEIRAGALAPRPREERSSRCDVIEMSPLAPASTGL